MVPLPPAKVMDHGFGSGNNLIFFASKGYECAGCEISENLIKEALKRFASTGKPVDLRPIKDLTIPFESDYFDIVVSWNVLHYNGTRDATQKVIDELRRVLKPNGILLLSTIHPDSSFRNRMKPLGNGSYFIEKESRYDNRKGLTFFIAESQDELKKMFSRFSNVKSGSACCDLFNPDKISRWYLIYAVK
jgi:SAM-dependent methyltransferase